MIFDMLGCKADQNGHRREESEGSGTSFSSTTTTSPQTHSSSPPEDGVVKPPPIFKSSVNKDQISLNENRLSNQTQLEDLSVTKSSTSPKSKSRKKAAENFNPEPKAAPKAVEVPNLPRQEVQSQHTDNNKSPSTSTATFDLRSNNYLSNYLFNYHFNYSLTSGQVETERKKEGERHPPSNQNTRNPCSQHPQRTAVLPSRPLQKIQTREIPEAKETQSIPHPPPPTLQSLTPNQPPHLLLIHLIKRTRAKNLPHLSRSVPNMTIRLRSKRTPQTRNKSRLCCRRKLSVFHLSELVLKGAVDVKSVLILLRFE